VKRKLEITTAVAAAFALSACERNDEWVARQDVRVCRDVNGARIDDLNCDRGARAWYYIPRGGGVPPIGGALSGGSFAGRPGVSYVAADAASVTRGGFGSIGRAMGHAFGRGG